MSKLKKIVAIVTVVGLAGLVAPSAQAVTADELLAQIQQLQEQLNQLMSQYQELTGETAAVGVPAACTGITFDRNLKQGMSGDDVKCLQALLNTDSDTKLADSGAGSPGNETTYFGPITKAAVVKFQEKYADEVLAPWGLTAGTGFVGSTTRDKLNSLLTAGAAEEGAAEEGAAEEGAAEEELPTAEGLTVELAADTPAATTIISDGSSDVAGSQALVPYLKLKFSTPAGTSAKVTTLKLKRIGVSTDTDIPNVYLYEGDTKLAEMTSLSSGIVTFTSSAGLFTVSGAKTITVKADLHKDATAGKTIGFSVAASSDITTDASAVNGTFPINGNLMTTAVVSDFGRLSVATSSNAATVDPGTVSFEAMRFILTSANQKIQVKSIKFQQLGSIQSSDVANLALYVGATQIGSTVANLESDGTVVFDLSSSPYEIPAGVSRIISLKVDVIGGSTRTIQFSIQRQSDIVAMDANYGVYVQPDNGTIATWTVRNSTSCTVASGNLIITRSTDSPSGNVALNSTNVSLAKWDVKAVGESIKVSQLTFNASTSGGTSWTNIRNVRILYDGVQVGTTQTTAASNTDYAVTLSFTAPVGVTKTLEIKADIKSAAGAGDPLAAGDYITMKLIAGSNNAQRMTSLGTFNFPGSDQSGNSVSVVSAALSAAKNQSVGDVSAVYNQQGVIIGSYLITAGAAEGVDISKFIFEDAASSSATTAGDNNLGAAFTNLSLWYGSTQLGSTIVPNPSSPAATYEFTPATALSLAAGQTIRVDLKADVLASPTWTNTNATKLSSVESTGKVTTNAANFTSQVAGQGITLSQAGTLAGATDPSSPEATLMAMGASGQTLGIWKLSANNVEPLTVSKIVVFNDGDANSVANYNNLKLYCGSEQFGSAAEALLPAQSAIGFNQPYAAFGGSCVVPKGGNTLITLKSDVTSYANGGQAGLYGQFYIEVPSSITGGLADKITARGAGDYANTTAGSSTANRMYTYRDSLTAGIACYGSCTGRTRSAADKLANLTLTSVNGVAKLRAAADIGDEATTNWTATSVQADATVATTTSNKIDGTYAIRFTESATSTVDDGVYYNYGTGINNYSKLSFWITSSQAKDAGDLEVRIASSSDRIVSTSTSELYTSIGALSASTKTYVEVNLTGLTATDAYIGIFVAANGDDGATWDIDAIRLYNDSITVDITGNSTDTNIGAPVYLKTSGGTTKAVGYFDYTNSKAVLVPSSEIAVSSSGTTLELITDTTSGTGIMEAAASGISRTLTLSMDLGTYGSAGDFRWYDQANTTPITWMNGASPISITISLATGN